MTAEQKAKELVEKFKPIVSIWDNSEQDITKDAKQCAIICVDEILSEILSFDNGLKDYYLQVKEEINKITA